ncbi:hypothetical protein HRW07_01785, partial [Streptomyces lunaelactis]|nr:hypothetical protein [Streptomyces lunaelactis]
MHQSWISFIRTGSPSPHPMPNWDRYDRNSRITMSLDTVTITATATATATATSGLAG